MSRDVLESSKELRLMLCRERRTGTRVGTSVIAACGATEREASEQDFGLITFSQHICDMLTNEPSAAAYAGIFVSDILEAVPIDKYFELFRPGAGGEGGFIRISINYEDLTRKTTSANGGMCFKPLVSTAEQRLPLGLAVEGAVAPADDCRFCTGGAAATTPQEFRTQVSIDPVEQGELLPDSRTAISRVATQDNLLKSRFVCVQLQLPQRCTRMAHQGLSPPQQLRQHWG